MAIIVRLDGNTPWFDLMNSRLIQSYSKLPMIMIDSHTKNFEDTYGVKVIIENNRWAAIEFANEFDLMSLI